MADVVIAALHQRKEGFLNIDVTVLLGKQRRSEDKQSPKVARGGGLMGKLLLFHEFTALRLYPS